MYSDQSSQWSFELATSRRRVFPQLFRVLPNFQECFYNSIETWITCFFYFFHKTPRWEKVKQLVNFDYQNVNSLCSCHHYVNSSCYTNTIFNQSAYFLRTVFYDCMWIKAGYHHCSKFCANICTLVHSCYEKFTTDHATASQRRIVETII